MTHPVAHNLALRDVSKHYGNVVAVDDVSLDEPRGRFLTLLGPSGSGKTTLLMIIAGFVEPNGGRRPGRRRATSRTCRPRSATSAWSSRATRSSRT